LMPDPNTKLEIQPRSGARGALLSLFVLLTLAAPLPLLGQIPDSTRLSPDSVLAKVEAPLKAEEHPSDTSEVNPSDTLQGMITPRGAFIRSGVIPGWGHSLAGAHGRGAFYFMIEAVSAFMLVKTQGQLGLARDRRVFWESVAIARLQARGSEILDPLELEAVLVDDPLFEDLELWGHVEDLRGLEEARSGQREDWIALSLFFLFLGGADAYVSTHLADFPGAVEINATPTGGAEVGFSLPIGR